MTTVSVTRKMICDAIDKEPTTTLASGFWASWSDQKTELTVRSRDCTVCAVGAVMRNAILSPQQDVAFIDAASVAATKDSHSLWGSPERKAKRGFYMSALSCFFESEWTERDIDQLPQPSRAYTEAVKQLKADCIQFVKKNFPARIVIDIDGASPARDVKVLEYSKEE